MQGSGACWPGPGPHNLAARPETVKLRLRKPSNAAQGQRGSSPVRVASRPQGPVGQVSKWEPGEGVGVG